MTSPARAPSQRAPLDRTARITVILLFSAWIVDYGDRLLVNLALPYIGADFGLSHTQQGLVLSAFFIAYALFQIPGGLLADRFGAVPMMILAIVLWSVFTALTAAALSFAMILAVRLFFGAAEGLFPGASMKAMSERTEPAQRMTANGWMQSSNAFAVLLAPLLAAPLIATWGWRSAFFVAAGLGILVLIALRRWLPGPRATVAGSEAVVGTRWTGARAVLRSPVMWRFAGMFFGYDIIVWGSASWVPSYLQTERGISVGHTSLITVLPAAIGGLGVVLGGWWSDRLAGRHRAIVLPAMTGAAGCLLVMAYAGSLVVFVVMLTAASALTALCYMPIFAVPLRSLPPRVAGSAVGLIGFGGQAAGIVAPLVMGVLVDAYDYRAAFLFLITGAVLAAGLALFTPQTSERFRQVLR